MNLTNDWKEILKDYINSKEYNTLKEKVEKEYNEYICYPKYNDIYNSLNLTSYKDTKVVIIGQDPYHGENEAHGLSFSVLCKKLPPSLKNIYKELYDDLNIIPSLSGDLTCWAKEGVLLLNSVLTVRKDTPGSHKNLGWQNFTDEIIKKLEKKDEVIVYILWGNYAKTKKELITNKLHYIIESNHPSPFSAKKGFFGSRPFSKTNKILKENNVKLIDWNVK